jgi:hypothetical protein
MKLTFSGYDVVYKMATASNVSIADLFRKRRAPSPDPSVCYRCGRVATRKLRVRDRLLGLCVVHAKDGRQYLTNRINELAREREADDERSRHRGPERQAIRRKESRSLQARRRPEPAQSEHGEG